MKKILFLMAVLASGWLAEATQEIYINNAPLTACCNNYVYVYGGGTLINYCTNPVPTIDANAFVNRSIFNVSVNCAYPSSPYEMLNLVNFTNTLSGSLYGIPGYRFDYFTENTRAPMNSWMNYGSVTGETWVVVSAQNISSSGFLVTGPAGLIRLNGDTINLNRDGLRSGQNFNTVYYGGGTYNVNGTNYNYDNATGVSDLYWGTGTNNSMGNRGLAMPLNTGQFDVPCSYSPYHEVIDARYGTRYTNFVRVPQYQYYYPPNCYVPYTAHVWSNQFGNTKYIQVVYVPQNNIDTSFRTDVRFYRSGINGGAAAAVAFEMIDQDVVSLNYITNGIYLVDHAAFTTNITLARPYTGYGTGRRPNNYEVFRYPPFEYSYGTNANAPFTNGLIYNPSYLSNQVNMLYAAYAVNLAAGTATSGIGGPGDPTNFPGRVEITGNVVNLDQTRIRAESTILIRAQENLVNNKLAKVDAPFCSYDLRSQQSPLYITNLAPAYVRRLSGNIYCWSALWDNYETNATGTNLVKFHVLMVDSALQSLQPVSVFEFLAHATNLVITDPLTISRNMLLDARDLHVRSTLNLPPGSPWGSMNVPILQNFTNDGFINIPQDAYYTNTLRPSYYHNFVNRGTNVAAAQFITATNFYNSGSVIASGGLLSLDTRTAEISGIPTVIYTNIFTNWYFDYIIGDYVTNVATNSITNSIGARLLANSDIQIFARDLILSNAIIQAGDSTPGKLIFSVTNCLINQGPDINQWLTMAGIEMNRQPTNSDLIYTYLTSKAGRFMEVPHIWNAQNRGASNSAGFSNNLALGKLTLDGDLQCLFRFSAPAGCTNRAMYVDYLELLNYATNKPALVIDPSLTIYVANASISPRKLELMYPGRIRWVPYFAGPLSSTNMVYTNSMGELHTYTFNIALVTDQGLDSDQDGIPNAYDPTPIYVGESMALNMTILPGTPQKGVVSWRSLGNSMNYLEYQTPPATNWVLVTNIPWTSPTNRICVTNTVPKDGFRFYRVRVNPPLLY